MATRIRMTRMGNKKAPSYRIVVTDGRVSRDAQYTEQIGFYNPLTTPVDLRVDKEKAEKWLATGAQPTDTVKALLVQAGVNMPAKKAAKAPAKKAATKKTK